MMTNYEYKIQEKENINIMQCCDIYNFIKNEIQENYNFYKKYELYSQNNVIDKYYNKEIINNEKITEEDIEEI